MPLENPKVQVKTHSVWGDNYQELQVDHNQQWNTNADWRYSLLYRLGFSPRLEVMIADCILWVSTSALLGNLLGIAVSLGIPSVGIAWFGLILLTPVLLWAIWVDRHFEKTYKEITGFRLLLVLLGFLLAVLLG